MRVRESGEASHLPPIAELAPGEDLHDVQPRAVDADAQELVELAHLGNGWIIGGLEQHPALFLERLNARCIMNDRLPLALEAHTEERRQWRSIPQPRRHQMRRQLLNPHQRDTL